MCKKLEETMHVLVRLLSPDSTFDLFQFLSKHFFQNLSCRTRGAAYLRVQLYASVYGKGFFSHIGSNWYMDAGVRDFKVASF